MTGRRMPNSRVPFFRNARRLRLRSCLRLSHFILFFSLDHTPSRLSRERRSGSRTSRAELAGGRSEAEEKAQERKKNGTSGVHGGGYFAPHVTRTTIFWMVFYFWIFIYTSAVLEHLQTAHHLPDGRFASRGALAELFLFIPRPHNL
jgi:hypothetical protein